MDKIKKHMEWIQVLIIIVSVFGMFLWGQRESHADRREVHKLINEIKNENKDFHGRLCALEEKYYQIQRNL